MGASGVGKDSLITAAQEKLGTTTSVHFARRFITRASGTGAENHVPLSPSEFEERERSGAFLFHWRSHGTAYAIGREVQSHLAAGKQVVVNGSRAYLGTARRICPRLLPVMLTCSDEAVLRRRLQQRGRETRAQIERRLHRNRELLAACPQDALIIDNSGDLDAAVAQFCRLLQGNECCRRP